MIFSSFCIVYHAVNGYITVSFHCIWLPGRKYALFISWSAALHSWFFDLFLGGLFDLFSLCRAWIYSCLHRAVPIILFVVCFFVCFSSGSYVNTATGPVKPTSLPHVKPPRLPPGVQLPAGSTLEKLEQFFQLFFTVDLVQHLCNVTNHYAQQHGPQKPMLYRGWTNITPQDLYMFMALLMYMAVEQAPNVECYRSTSPLFHWLWARHFMSKWCLKTIQSFLKVCNPQTESSSVDKLLKVRFLHDYIHRKCIKLYQPFVNVSVYEGWLRRGDVSLFLSLWRTSWRDGRWNWGY